jgi:hypothetical protein
MITMHHRSDTRFSAAATALLLTASAAGLALTSGSAQATGSHHAATARAATLTVTITSTKSGPKLSLDKLRPGNTLFKVVRGNKGGDMQLLRLRAGYSLKHAFSDFTKLNGDPINLKALRRIDRNVIFYGGVVVPAKGAKPAWWGVDLDKADTYYVANGDQLTRLTTKGSHQRRSLPATNGRLGMKTIAGGANAWAAPKTDPHKGWMKTTNNAREPHFVVLAKVKESTTNQDVQDALMSDEDPSFVLGPELDTNIISPGHTFVWKYGTSRGKYLALCFWPSKVDGTPHAVMGMFKLFHLI